MIVDFFSKKCALHMRPCLCEFVSRVCRVRNSVYV